MPLDTDILDADLGYQIADLKVTFVFGGTGYDGSRGMLRQEDVLMAEGLADQYRFSLNCQASAFAGVDPPDGGDTVTIAGTSYRVLASTTDAMGQQRRLDLGEEHIPS